MLSLANHPALIPSSRSRNVLHIQRNYRTLRHLQLYIQLLNVVNQHLIFTCKLICIGVCITSGYAAIAHFMSHPVYGIMYVVLFLNCAPLYVLVYDKAFRTPSLLKHVKGTLRLKLYRERNSFQRKIMDRRVMSIPMLGVKVGTFHVMERTSTPVFLHYVLSSIVSMLLAYA